LQADDLPAAAGVDDFTAYKAERESKRETEVAFLDGIIEDANTDAETLKDAQEQKMAIVAAMEAETNIEGLLVASCGFENVIVTVKEGSVNVVIDADSITSEDAAKVLEIVQQETDEPAQNIKILLS
jgi:stage III sporulation protein AH